MTGIRNLFGPVPPCLASAHNFAELRPSADAVLDMAFFIRSFIETIQDVEPLLRALSLSDLAPACYKLLALGPVERVKVIKYWCCFPLARWLRDEHIVASRPPCLSGSYSDLPFQGRLRRHLKNLLSSRTTSARSAACFNSMNLGIKRGCRTVSEDFQADACRKHRSSLSTPTPPPDVEIPMRYYDDIWRIRVHNSAVIRGWREKSRPDTLLSRSTQNPSSHSTFTYTRGMGGRAAATRDHRDQSIFGEAIGPLFKTQDKTPGLPDGHWLGPMTPIQETGRSSAKKRVAEADAKREIDQLLEGPRGSKHKRSRLSEANKSHDVGLLDMYEVNGKVVERHALDRLRYSDVLKMSTRIMTGGGELHHYRPLNAMVALCLEPLKCRVITKGEALPYLASQTFQKHSWSALQRHAPFALTGRTLAADDLYGVYLKTRALGLKFDQWVSGDYSAATDGLSLAENQRCLGSMLDSSGCTPEERYLCSQVNGAHLVHYPKSMTSSVSDGELDPVLMLNGQLMGSPLSFPVLCAINLACYRAALAEYMGHDVEIDELPVLVNGDDICFMANEAFYAIWKKWVVRAGFTLSLGKNYISPNYVTINSKGYHWREGPPGPGQGSSFKLLPAFAAGLLLEHAPGDGVSMREKNKEKPQTSKWEALLNSCSDSEFVFKRLLYHQRGIVESQSVKGYYNLFAPVELGGLGVKCPEPLKKNIKFTYSQQLMAGAALAGLKAKRGTWITESELKTGYESQVLKEGSRVSQPTSTTKSGFFALGGIGPLKEGHERIAVERRVAPDLMNDQQVAEIGKPEYRTRHPNQRSLRAAFAANTPMKRPFDFPYLRVRHHTKEGPTDEASLAVSALRNQHCEFGF